MASVVAASAVRLPPQGCRCRCRGCLLYNGQPLPFPPPPDCWMYWGPSALRRYFHWTVGAAAVGFASLSRHPPGGRRPAASAAGGKPFPPCRPPKN